MTAWENFEEKYVIDPPNWYPKKARPYQKLMWTWGAKVPPWGKSYIHIT